MKRAVRYQAAIMQGRNILLIQQLEHKSGRAYWLLPGGGIEAGETEIECVQREVLEETHLEVAVERLLLDTASPSGLVAYPRYKTYLCRPTAGEPKPGYEPEEEAAALYAIVKAEWHNLYDESTWDTIILDDPITAPLLRQVRAALA